MESLEKKHAEKIATRVSEIDVIFGCDQKREK